MLHNNTATANSSKRGLEGGGGRIVTTSDSSSSSPKKSSTTLSTKKSSAVPPKQAPNYSSSKTTKSIGGGGGGIASSTTKKQSPSSKKHPVNPDTTTQSLPLELKPSLYIKQRSLSISERLIAMAAEDKYYTPTIVELIQPDEAGGSNTGTGSLMKASASNVPIDCPIFEAIPSKILLQKYEPFQTYEIVITFRNNDKVARRIQLEQITVKT